MYRKTKHKKLNTRVYTHKGKDINTLLSWTQRRCISCSKFLSLYGKKYCIDCRLKAKRETTKTWKRNKQK